MAEPGKITTGFKPVGQELKKFWRDGREAEGAPLLREYGVYSSIEGSNPSLSAIFLSEGRVFGALREKKQAGLDSNPRI